MNYNLKLFIKRVLLTLLFFLYMAGVHALPSGKYSLVIEFKDGTTQTFLLSSRPNVGFVDNQFVISQGDSNVEFAFDDVASFSFLDKDAANIHHVYDGGLAISYADNHHLIIQGAKGKIKVSIANLEGKNYKCDIHRQDASTITVSLENLSSGVYVVSIGENRTFKIVRKWVQKTVQKHHVSR